MKYFKDGPIGLWIVSVSIIIFTIYYYIRPFLEGVVVSTVYSPMLEFTFWGFIFWINLILEIISIYAVTYGFYYKKNWARLYTIAFNCLSVFLILHVIFIEKLEIFERYVWIVFLVIITMYLMMSHVREYFGVKKLFF